MRLARELGVMALDAEGCWQEQPLPSSDLSNPAALEGDYGLIESDSVNHLEGNLDLLPPNRVGRCCGLCRGTAGGFSITCSRY